MKAIIDFFLHICKIVKQINTPPVIEPAICSQVPVLFAVNPVEKSRFVIGTSGALVVKGYPSIHTSPTFCSEVQKNDPDYATPA